jgi:hypothetical protein
MATKKGREREREKRMEHTCAQQKSKVCTGVDEVPVEYVHSKIYLMVGVLPSNLGLHNAMSHFLSFQVHVAPASLPLLCQTETLPLSP